MDQLTLLHVKIFDDLIWVYKLISFISPFLKTSQRHNSHLLGQACKPIGTQHSGQWKAALQHSGDHPRWCPTSRRAWPVSVLWQPIQVQQLHQGLPAQLNNSVHKNYLFWFVFCSFKAECCFSEDKPKLFCKELLKVVSLMLWIICFNVTQFNFQDKKCI